MTKPLVRTGKLPRAATDGQQSLKQHVSVGGDLAVFSAGDVAAFGSCISIEHPVDCVPGRFPCHHGWHTEFGPGRLGHGAKRCVQPVACTRVIEVRKKGMEGSLERRVTYGKRPALLTRALKG